MSNFVQVFVIFCVFNSSYSIYTPQNQESLPVRSNVKNGNAKINPQIQMHHNYSHVNYQNTNFRNVNATNRESKTKIYPIYQSRNDVNSSLPIQKIVRVKKQLEIYEKCPQGATGQFVYTLSCSQFLNCWKGRTFVQTCAPGTLFNPDTLTCDFPQKVKCITGPRSGSIFEEPPPQSPTPIPSRKDTRDVQQKCPTNFSGKIPNYLNCSEFFVCNRGESVTQMCPQGTLFDTNRNTCDSPKFAKCFNDQNRNNQRIEYIIIRDPIKPSSDHGYYRTFYESKVENCENDSDCPTRRPDGIPQGSNCERNCRNETGEPTYIYENYEYDQGGSSNCFPPNCNNTSVHQQQGRNDQIPSSSNVRIISQACNPQYGNCKGSSDIASNQNPRKNDFDSNKPLFTPRPQYQNLPHNNFNTPNPFHSSNVPRETLKIHCPQGVMGLHPHPTDCTKFLNCANGQTFIQTCGPGTMFNPKMMTCDFDYNVECNRGVPEVTDNSLESHTTYPPNWYTKTSTSKRPSSNSRDYDYDFSSNQKKQDGANSLWPPPYSKPHQDQKTKLWPPPFYPSTDTNADYVFENAETNYRQTPYKDNIDNCQNDDDGKTVSCRDQFQKCISKNLFCNGRLDCPNGNDEINCERNMEKFDVKRGVRLAILEKERWDNTTLTSCAYLCLQSKKFECKSFNYRNIDNCCFLSDSNEGTSGKLIAFHPNDYYELKSSKLNCTDMFKCNNNKCLDKTKVCDGKNDCGEMEDEKNCDANSIGYEIRLTGSKNKWEGRLEVSAFGRIGYICDDRFDIRAANVACKELGYSMGAAEVKGNSQYAKDVPLNKVVYMMDDIFCIGNETSIRECDFNGWGSHDCTDQEIVGISCKNDGRQDENCPENFWKCKTTNECVPMAFVCDGPEDCTDGSDENEQFCSSPIELRLVNGTRRSEGRIEVKYHDVWGTICDDDFNDDAAKVVCKNLGYKGTVTVKKDAYFGEGTGPIWLDQVACFGNETNLEKCTHWNWGEHNCDHSEDVGVICSDSDNYFLEKHVKTAHTMTTPPINVVANSDNSIYPSTCGLQKYNLLNSSNDDIHFRVVQGSKAVPGSFPWQAALRVKGKLHTAHWCGAVIISSHFLLTAAHCLVGYPKGAYVLIAGDYNVSEDEGTEQQAYIENFYVHEGFRKGHKMNNDIALIKLKGNGFRLNQDVQAICLPEIETKYDTDLNCTISGFGSIESGTSAFSNELRAGYVPIQSDDVCKMPHVYGESLTDGMFCAGTLDGGVDSCDGDSGGPLACLNEGFYTLYGITSWGQRCGYANKPGVYVKVAHYRRWIDENIRTNIQL